MTRRLPHVGLSTSVPGESLYGDNSTIGAHGQAERAATLDWFASALGLRGRLDQPEEPIRVTASVGQPIHEIEAEIVEDAA